MKFNAFKEIELENNKELKEEYDALENEFIIKQTLIDLRKGQHITQKELSEKTGISQSDISKLENGKANPSLNLLSRIANALNSDLKIEFVERKNT